MTSAPAPDPAARGAVEPAIMAARYGSGPSPSARRRGLVAAIVVAALVLLAAVGLQAASLREPRVEVQNLGFTVVDPTRTNIRFTLVAEPGTTARCTLVALNEAFTQVGFGEITVGPLDERMTSHTADITTTELATTGSVESCVVAE